RCQKSVMKRLRLDKRFFFAVSTALLVMAGAVALHAGDNENCLEQFNFAENLFKEGDYYRAITEYKRFIFSCTQDGTEASREKAAFMIGVSALWARQWNDATQAFNDFIQKHPGSFMASDALFLKGKSEQEARRYSASLDTFHRLYASSTDDETRSKASYHSGLVYLDLEEWHRAKDMFALVSEYSSLFPAAQTYSSGLEAVDNLPRKNPSTAGLLAAVAPGAGHLYTERPRDALVAFLLNASFIWAAVELFNDENYVAGGVVTFFELGWYGGNIYSAVSSAHKYNKRVTKEFIEKLKDRSKLSLYHDPARGNNYLLYSLAF
ncbi:MAG: tetratricopeptide repeat protein, partial [Deltaproteobacteria bacterium]|nr:tetratricopeptide repeat protein [Deltaproteobacteria bacterium]